MRTRSIFRPVLAVFAGLLLVLGLAACGDDDDAASTDDTVEDTAADDTTTSSTDAPEDGGAADATVVAVDFSLTSVTVAPGASVTLDNQGEKPHTLTADDDSFDSGRVEAGAQGTVTAPSEAGTYDYHCDIHPAMTGTLTVEG